MTDTLHVSISVQPPLGQLPPPSPADLAERWLAAFNAADLNGLIGLYAEDAVHHSPKLRAQQPETLGRISGRPALRAWWADSFARLPGLHYRKLTLTADAEQAVLEYDRELPGTPTLRVAELFRCAQGQIVESRVYHG